MVWNLIPPTSMIAWGVSPFKVGWYTQFWGHGHPPFPIPRNLHSHYTVTTFKYPKVEGGPDQFRPRR